MGADLKAGGFAVSVVELFGQVDVVDGGWWLGHGGLVLDCDGADAVVGAQVGVGGATLLGLAGDVELTVGGSHVGVWDGADTVSDDVGDLVGVVVEPWFLASEVDVLFAGGWVGGDGASLSGDLDASGLACEVPRVEDHSANSDWIVGGVNLRSGSVASFRHVGLFFVCRGKKRREGRREGVVGEELVDVYRTSAVNERVGAVANKMTSALVTICCRGLCQLKVKRVLCQLQQWDTRQQYRTSRVTYYILLRGLNFTSCSRQ